MIRFASDNPNPHPRQYRITCFAQVKTIKPRSVDPQYHGYPQEDPDAWGPWSRANTTLPLLKVFAGFPDLIITNSAQVNILKYQSFMSVLLILDQRRSNPTPEQGSM